MNEVEIDSQINKLESETDKLESEKNNLNELMDRNRQKLKILRDLKKTHEKLENMKLKLEGI